MSELCRIKRANEVPTDAELTDFFFDVIEGPLSAIYGDENYLKNGQLKLDPIRRAVVKYIRSLGQKYSPSEYEYIKEAINNNIGDSDMIDSNIIPQSNIVDILSSKESETQIISRLFSDKLFEEEDDDSNYLLEDAYGTAYKAKKQLELKMKNYILKSFIVDRDSGDVVNNITQAINKLENIKVELAKEIQDFFKDNNFKSDFNNIDLNASDLSEVLNTYEKDINKQLQIGTFSSQQIQTMYDDAYGSKTTQTQKKSKLNLDAYGAWLALKHIDNFINLTLGDTIIINPSSEQRYFYSSKGTNVNGSHRYSDDINLDKEINKLTQALITTSPMFIFGRPKPTEGSYLQFSDFTYITAKLKDLMYSKTASEHIFKYTSSMKYLSEAEKNFIKGKSLRQVIAHSRLNPQVYTPLIYKLLLTNNSTTPGTQSYLIDSFNAEFNDQDKNILWTVYKNLYSELQKDDRIRSLYNIQLNNKGAKNYYSAVTQVSDTLFSVDFSHFVYEDGIIKMRSLRDSAVGKIKQEIKNIINTRNSPKLRNLFPNEYFEIEEYKDESDNISGLRIKIPQDGDNTPLYIHVTKLGERIFINNKSNNTVYSTPNLDMYYDSESVKRFIDDTLGLNLSTNHEFRKAYEELVKQGNNYKSPYVESLLELAAHVYFNRHFSENYLSNHTTASRKYSVIKRTFNPNKEQDKKVPRFNNTFFDIEMVPDSKLSTINKLSQALGSVRGINSSRQVKDADNAALSSQSLSRLWGSLIQQFETQIDMYNKLNEIDQELKKQPGNETLLEERKNLIKNSYLLDDNKTPPAAHFSIIKNKDLFRGLLKAEEIKGFYNNKKQVDFTTAEAVTSSFLHNFVLGHCDKNLLENNSKLGDGIIGLLPSVNADKNSVGIAMFDLNSQVFKDNDQLWNLLNYKGFSRDILWKDLDNSQILTVLQTELSLYYTQMTNNIRKDFQLLGQSAKVNIDYDNNFREFKKHVVELNEVRKQQGLSEISESEVLLNLVKSYNSSHSDNPIKLTDQVHFISKEGRISRNRNIVEMTERFNNFQKTKQFFDIKNCEILKSAMDANFTIDLYGNSDLEKQPEVLYLRTYYDNWINDAGQMVLARVNYNEISYNISNKTDLRKLEKVITKDRMQKDGINPDLYELNTQFYKSTYGCNLLKDTYVLKGNIKLHPMIEKYNLLDYMFTQEFLYSTVGSHVAHEPKGNFNMIPSSNEIIKSGSYKASSGVTLDIETGDYDELVSLNYDIDGNAHLEVNYDKLRNELEKNDIIELLDKELVFLLEKESAKLYNKRQDNESYNDYEERMADIGREALLFKEYQGILAEEAARFYAQHKRNVSFTAQMSQFQLNQIDGIPLYYNIACIEDIFEDVFTVDGNSDTMKPFDGATYVNPIVVYLENKSLNESRAGIDKKQFIHFYDEKTGTGGVIKTAGFGLTNLNIKNSLFYRKMVKKMMDIRWKTHDNKNFDTDITKNYNGQNINYGKFYFEQDGKYYKSRIEYANELNTYIRYKTEVDKFGNEIGEESYDKFIVDTNYKLWNLFGGEDSMSLNNGVLKHSESSLQLLVTAVNEVGTIISITNKLSQSDIDQPLKTSNIHYIPTKGAIKQGAGNINPSSSYTDDSELNTFKIRITCGGIQLDKEHVADKSVLSLMTQVISSACSMGFNPKQQKKLYQALYNLTSQGIKQYKSELQKFFKTNNSENFDRVITESIVTSMLNSPMQEGDMLRIIADDLIRKARGGTKLSFEDTQTMAYSETTIFEKLTTTISSILTKSGIKTKMSGILSVLCPTQEIVKIYNIIDEQGIKHNLTLAQLEKKYGKYDKVIDQLQERQPDIINPADINVGYNYKVKIGDNEIIMSVKFPDNSRINTGNNTETIGRKALMELMKSGKATKVQEYIKEGRELNTINYRFKGFVGNESHDYCIWDVDLIQDLFDIIKTTKKLTTQEKIQKYQDLIQKYEGSLDNFNSAKNEVIKTYSNPNVNDDLLLRLLKQYTRSMQQNVLFILSKNNPNKDATLKIDGRDVSIDKQSIQIEPYELVMPKIFLEEFGLEQDSSLDEIVNNPNYFYDRMVSNFSSKIYDESLYDIELKKISGKHIYIKDGRDANNWNADLEEVVIFKKRDESGKLWRKDLLTKENIHELYDNSDKVYRIKGTDIEIITTNSDEGIEFYLNSFRYESLHIGTNDQTRFDRMFDLISNSKNTTAKNWTNLFKDGDKIQLNRELNEFNELGKRLREHLMKQSKIVHTSFLKSLDVIAARIPAQNQQSFMPMKVVAFDDNTVNTAFVSAMQFFLQGSDLDIDAVSLLTHTFNDSGEFFTWSPLFDLNSIDLLNESINIPFPTGENLTIEHTEDENLLLENQPDYNYLLNFEENKAKLGESTYQDEIDNIKRKISETKDEYELKQLQNDLNKLLRDQIKYLKCYINLLEYINKSNGVVYFKDDKSEENAKLLIDRINEHNNFLTGVSDKTITGAIKNYVVSSLFSISTDAANLLEAHTSVDVATKPLKNIANASDLSKVQKTFTSGNFFNKFQAIEEASVGQDDIAICATGLKSFFAATQLCNSFLNDNILDKDNRSEVNKLSSIIEFTPVEIGGKKFNTLANIRVDDINRVNKQADIYKILKNKGFEDDASVVMSALLSLATDNAKELCLAKINAGTKMMGLYIYGTAIGMDFDILNKIIASPLGFVINDLLHSNEFTKDLGFLSINEALHFLYNGPSKQLNKYDISLKEKGGRFFKSVSQLFDEACKTIENDKTIDYKQALKEDQKLSFDNIGEVLAYLSRTEGQEYTLQFLENIEKQIQIKLNKLDTKKLPSKDLYDNFLDFKANVNQLLNYLNDFVYKASTLHSSNTDYSTVYGDSNIFEDLNKLLLGADEFKRLGQFLRLNQEIKTKSDELIDFILRFETLINERVKLLKSVYRRLGYDTEGLDQEDLDFIDFAKSFMIDESENSYYKQMVEQYENCKTCINPLRVLTEVDHYKGYFESLIVAYFADNSKSIKFRSIKNLANKFMSEYNIKSKKEKQSVVKGVKDFVDDFVNNHYLMNEEMVVIPNVEGAKLIDEYGGATDINEDTEIRIGTKEGNANFEYFFEGVFIDKLKEKFANNLFVKELTDVLIVDYNTKVTYLAKSLPINMMPFSQAERDLFNIYKSDFTELSRNVLEIGNFTYNIGQMFHYYNLIKFKGKVGKNTLAKIFEDIIGNASYFVDYRKVYNKFDKEFDFSYDYSEEYKNDENRIIINVDKENLMEYLSPLSNPYSTFSKAIKYYDKNSGKTVLLEDISQKQEYTEEDENGNYGMDENYDENYDDDEVYDNNIELDYDEYYDEDESKSNYGRFTVKNKNLSKLDVQIINNYNYTIESFDIDQRKVQKVIIKEGKLKSFLYDGKTYTIDNDVMKINKDNNTIKYIDFDKVRAVIENKICNG